MLIEAHPFIDFGWNLIKIYGVMTNFSHKRLKVCTSCRLNHWKELVETWHVNVVIIIGVPFCGLKESGKRPQR